MTSFYTRLSYSFGNEDWTTEDEALKIKNENRVLCVSASGDRPLHLLMKPCKEMVAIDINAAQSHLLQLKAAALKNLSHEDYLAFLGASPCYHRLHLFNSIKKYLPESSLQYWLENTHMIDKGIIYQGATERWAKKLSIFPKIILRKQLQKLFSTKTLKEQQEFLSKEWNHRLWLTIFKLGLHPIVTRLFFRDPGLFKNLPKSTDPGEYYYRRMMENLRFNVARDNPLLSIWLLGTVEDHAFPPYLTKKGTEAIIPHLDRLTIKTKDVISYLEAAPDQSFDRFSLSDVASYLDYQDFVRLLKNIKRTAKPGARFCLRQFMSRHAIPDDLQKHFQREPQLEAKLEKEDRAFVYHFTVGTVQ